MDNEVPHVAIVDDEYDAVTLLRRIFSMSMIPVCFVAYNGQEAIERYRQAGKKPNVIIMDHRMPLASGIEATREILAMDPDVKIIFLSADPDIEPGALDAGAIRLLKKPASLRTIVETVRDAI